MLSMTEIVVLEKVYYIAAHSMWVLLVWEVRYIHFLTWYTFSWSQGKGVLRWWWQRRWYWWWSLKWASGSGESGDSNGSDGRSTKEWRWMRKLGNRGNVFMSLLDHFLLTLKNAFLCSKFSVAPKIRKMENFFLGGGEHVGGFSF